MGGGAYTGNSNAVAEFNILADPEAANIVFASGVKIMMCGLDVTLKAIITSAEIEQLKALGNKAGDFAAEAFSFYLDMYRKSRKDSKFDRENFSKIFNEYSVFK